MHAVQDEHKLPKKVEQMDFSLLFVYHKQSLTHSIN